MINLILAVKLLFGAAVSGIEWAVVHLREPVEKYLRGLRRLVTVTFLPPLIVSVIATLFGWRTLVGWMGVWCFVFTILLAHYGVPLGALIDALIVKKGVPDELRWLGQRLKSYISFVRQVLIYEAAAFITLNLIPIQNYWTGVPVFALLIGLLLVTSFEWGTETGKWLKPLTRISSFVAVIFMIICFFFPNINFFNLLLYRGVPPADKPTTREQVTEKEVVEGITYSVKGISSWVEGHYQQPSFWIVISVILLLTYLMVKMFRKTSASAGTGTGDRQASTSAPRSEGGRGSGWLGIAAVGAFLLLCVALIAKTLIGAHEERSARIEREIQVARANHEERAAIQAVQSAAIAAQAQAQQQQAAQQAATLHSTPERRSRYINSRYSITLSTNLSEAIPRPFGFSTQLEPVVFPYEFWTNGVFAAMCPGSKTRLEGVTYVQYRWTNPNPTNVVVEIWKEVE